MRILVLSNCPLVESQGSGYVVLNYARELRALGHDVLCVGPESLELLPSLRIARFWRLSAGTALAALRARLACDTDLIEFYGGSAWLAVLLLRVLRTPATLVHHSNGLETRSSRELMAHCGTDTHDGRPRRWYQFRGHRLVTNAFTRVDGLVLVSELEERFACAMRYQPRGRRLTLETPLPPSFIDIASGASRPMTIGYCGAWLPNKGVAIIGAVCTAALRRHAGLRVMLAGVGDRFRVKEVFPQDVVDRVEVSPFIASKADLQVWYRSVAVLLMPSYSESFGLVVSEAMACGCAVVASRTGFAASLVNREEALIVDGFAPEAYEEAVDALLNDDGLRDRIARRGCERVRGIRWPDAGKRLEEFYRSLCTAESRRALPAHT